MKGLKTGTVVVGTGPGGSTVARELAGRGEDVIILEKGRDHQFPIGSIMAYATMYDIKRSKDGILVRRGITTGGSTMLYSGNAYDPPAFLKDEIGLDLSKEVEETKTQLDIKPIPEYFFKDYTGTIKLVEAADSLGHQLEPQKRFIDPDKCDPTCDRCLFGCKRGAKWTAREFMHDAVNAGATLYTRHSVEEVLVSGGSAEGVRVSTPEGAKKIMADRVILSAGGIGTPVVLQKSGVTDAGSHFFTDPMSVMASVMGNGEGTFHEMTYTFADESNVGEFVLGNVGAVNAFIAQVAVKNIPYLRKALQMKKLTGMFVKLCDEPSGRIDASGKMHKAFTKTDEKRMAKGVDIAKQIMIKAGVEPGSIAVAKGIGGHPGGTAAIGRVIGNDLQTRIKNLYVCDNSIMPHSGGIPPVLTLISLAKYAARNIF